MAVRRPVVRIAGKNQQLPEGDVIAGIPMNLPFYRADGSYSPIPLTTSGELRFFLADGTQSNIPMVTS